MTLLTLSAARYYKKYAFQTLLSLIGIALGVAVVIGIDSAGTAAYRSFVASVESVAGKTTHTVISDAGGVEETAFYTVAQKLPEVKAAPVIEEPAQFARQKSRGMKLLGIDPFSETEFRDFTGFLGSGGGSRSEGGGFDIATLLTLPGAILLTERTANELGFAVGDTLTLLLRRQPHSVILVGTISPNDGTASHIADELVITDIATAQELNGMIGFVSRIDLIFPAEAAKDSLAVLELIGEGYKIETTGARSASLSSLSDSFLLNLRALSYLSLIVGMFLIYNTVSFAVVRRKRQFGLLTTIGMTKSQVFLSIFRETLLLGTAGAVIGGFLGTFLAQSFLQVVSQTINDMYVEASISGGADTATIIKGVSLGILASLIAALPAAAEAAKVQPAELLRRYIATGDGINFRTVFFGIAAAVLGVVWLLIDTTTIFAGYGALLLFIVAFSAFSPLYTRLGITLLHALGGSRLGIIASYSALKLRSVSRRTAVAVATLAVALAASFGVGTMVESFRSTVDTWLQRRLQADIYISPGATIARTGPVGTIDAAVVRAISQVEGVSSISEHHAIRVDFQGGKPDVGIFYPHSALNRFSFVQLPTSEGWANLEKISGRVIISEPFARKYNIAVGQPFTLPTPDRKGVQCIAEGIFYDYGSEQGLVLMKKEFFREIFSDSSVSGLGVYVDSQADVQEVVAGIRAIEVEQEFAARRNKDLREESLAVFDRTFAITSVLRLLSTFIAFVGIISTLTAIHFDSLKETGVLRAVGITPQQGRSILLLQSGIIGVLSIVAALPLGYILALVLAEVINVRSFGWSLLFGFSWYQTLLLVATAAVAAFIGGILPASRILTQPLAQVLRSE